jgi:diaminohydroxyphosphoribosylaminopyrimidine deaminase/5-amino-6-(5-phosphoribosylamino)uracil reductase
LIDDPLLTARLTRISDGAPRQPLRVVLDSKLRLPPSSQLAATANVFPTLIVTSTQADDDRARILQSCGIEILRWETDTDGRIELKPLLEELGRREVASLLVEGGGESHAAFLAAELADRLLWFVAPKLAGGREAPSAVGGLGIARMEDAIRVESLRVRRLGPDLLLDGKPVWNR